MKRQKRFFCLLIIIALTISMFTLCVNAASDDNSDKYEPGRGIDYYTEEIIVTGITDSETDNNFYINLTKETITLPADYTVEAYSLDGGLKWKSISSNSSKQFSDEMLGKFFSKDFTLVLTNRYDKKAKEPERDAFTVTFPEINARPKMDKYIVNYSIGEDSTGATTGEWVLTEKNGVKSVKDEIEIAVADGKVPDSNGYGRFYGEDGSTDGIAIRELSSDGKTVKTTYFIRYKAKDNGNGVYTAASKPKKITVDSLQKASTYKVNKKNIIKYKANTHILNSVGKVKNSDLNNVELKNAKGELDLNDYSGSDIYLWKAATEKKPASAKQKVSVTLSNSGILSIDTDVVSTVKTDNNYIRVNDFEELRDALTYLIDDEGNQYDTIVVEKSFEFMDSIDVLSIEIDTKTNIEIIGEAVSASDVYENSSDDENTGEENPEQGQEQEQENENEKNKDKRVVLTAAGFDRHFIVGQDVSVTFSNIILDGGKNGGGIENNGKVILGKDSVIQNCLADYGGGVYNDYNGILDIKSGGAVTGNDVYYSGGDSITGNGGGIYNNGGTVNIEKGAWVTKNSAAVGGGGIYSTSYYDYDNDKEKMGEINIYGTVSENSAPQAGGIANMMSRLNIKKDGLINKNLSSKEGGGVINWLGVMTVEENGIISGNTADKGGGVYNCGGSLSINKGGIIKENIAVNDGGGIFNTQYFDYDESKDINGKITVLGSIKDNTAANHGGGVYNDGISQNNTVTVETTGVIENNTAKEHGYGFNMYSNSIENIGTDSKIQVNDVIIKSGGMVKCIIQFNSNGGNRVSNDVTVNYKGKVSAPSAPTRTGHNFAGWYIDADLVNPWNFDDTIYDNATMYAKWLNSSGSEQPVTDLTLNKTETTLKKGGTEILTATVLPSDATNKIVIWKSSDPSIVTVDQNGKLSGKAAGTAVISADIKISAENAAYGYISATCTVSVEAVESGIAAAANLSENSVNLNPAKNNSNNNSATDSGSPPTQKLYIDKNGKEYIDPELVDTKTLLYTIKFSEDEIKNNSAYVAIPAYLLTNFAKTNPDFVIEIAAPYGIYQVPASLASLVPNINEMLQKNNLKLNSTGFKITLKDKSNDTVVNDALDSNMLSDTVISSAVDFTVELVKLTADGKTGETIAAINNFSERITRLIPMSQDIINMPEYWGAFKYNESMKRFDFVPHTLQSINGILYAGIESTTNSIYIVAENRVTFADINLSEWYTEYITKAASKKLVQGIGNGLYEPNRNVTRAEFIQMIVNALQLPQAKSDTKDYSDVLSRSWYYEPIMRAKSAGLLVKFSGSYFYPDHVVTREEMAVILAAAVRYENLEPEIISGSFSDTFSDYSSFDAASIGDIELVYSLNIMNGIGEDLFDPKGTSTRAQAATVQIRLLELLELIDRD